MNEYFYKKEYKYMYLWSLSYNFANALIETFGTVMLYKNGIPIWLILLIYGLRFGITGLCTTLFINISLKLGIAKCILISNIFKIIRFDDKISFVVNHNLSNCFFWFFVFARHSVIVLVMND